MQSRVLAPLACSLLATAAAQDLDQTPRSLIPDTLPPAAESGLIAGGFLQGVGIGVYEASSSTRTAGIGTPVTSPFTLGVPGLPTGATATNLIVSWHYLSDDLPATDTIQINGTPVTGNLVGSGDPDLCWGKDLGGHYLIEWTDPTDSPVVIGGSNTITDACDKPLGTDPAALGEGISIWVTYKDACSPERTVRLSGFGYTSTLSTGTGSYGGTLPFANAYVSGPVTLLMNALDGQDTFVDTLFLNGVDVSGTVGGTNIPGDAFAGFSGPDATNNLYDIVEGDVSALVAPADVSMDMSGTGEDCIGVTMAWTVLDTGNCSATEYCTPATGSSNNLASISISSCDLANGTTVSMTGCKPKAFTYLMIGDSNGVVSNPPGADADLCITGGSLMERYIGDLGQASAAGSFSTDISNSASGGPGFGVPGGGVIDAGETYTFQYWHRNGQGQPSRFSSALCVTFY